MRIIIYTFYLDDYVLLSLDYIIIIDTYLFSKPVDFTIQITFYLIKFHITFTVTLQKVTFIFIAVNCKIVNSTKYQII